jgi:mannose-6-phosphate isomerase-like protein (cupin superfamily)
VTDFVIRRWDLDPYPGDQAPPHVHHRSDEGFCVLSGQLEVLVGQVRKTLNAGDHVVIPSGVTHTFATVGDQPVQMLAVMTPEVDELVAALHEDSSAEQRAAIWARYNSSVVADTDS